MNKAELRIDWATHKSAKYACEHWHYSKSVPIGKTVKIGAWENGVFVGVIIFSRGTCGHLFDRFSISAEHGCELTRVAMSSHKFMISRAIAIACKMLKKKFPSMRLVVSFADRAQGHSGAIYQAGNWIYDGETSFKQEYILNGRKVCDRVVSQLVKERKINRKDLEKAHSMTKHRYFMPLDNEMRAKIEPLAKPYPKRPKKHESGDQPGSGRGSTDPDAPLFCEVEQTSGVT